MTLKDKFLVENSITGKKRLGPLAWVSVFITVLFVAACVLGWYQLLTRNVAPLMAGATSNVVQPLTVSTNESTGSETRPAGSITATRSITWTVWQTQDALTGRSIYDGPVEIKQWAVRDYEAAQQWMLDHLFERDYLLAHLADYFTGNALEMERGSLAESFDKTHLIWAPLIAQPRQPAPLDRPLFESFSADGRQMGLTDYTNSGNWKQYNTQTRALMPSQAHKFFWVYTMEFDPPSARWKIARLREIYDIDANRPSYSNEP